MEEILQEIKELKTQQLAFNNMMLENGKQNEMIFVVLKELLSELREEKGKDSLKDAIENILAKLEVLIGKLDELEKN